jgi:hypothetical protein
MEPISLILGALLAGHTKGASESATAPVKDAYAALRGALRRSFVKPESEAAIEEYVADPDGTRLIAEAHLKQAGADKDLDVLEAAEAVMQAADPEGARGGKYSVTITGSQGVQVGDHGSQTNYFGPRP